MRTAVKIIVVFLVISIITSFVGYMMDWKIISFAIPFNIFLFFLLLFSALYNNYLENKKFRQFLQKAKHDQALKNEHERPTAHKSRVKRGEFSHHRTRKIGLTWTAGTVHGAVPKRTDRRTFLSRR